jgi:lysozyme
MGLSEILAAIFSIFKQPPVQYDGTNGNGYQPVAVPGPAPTPPAPVLADPVPATAQASPVTPVPVSVTADDAWRALCRPLVQHFESCALGAYWDPTGKVWTCGWGSTGPDVRAFARGSSTSGLSDSKIPLRPPSGMLSC